MAWEWKWVPQILQGFRFLFFPLFGAPIFRIWDSVGSLQKIHARGSDWKSSKDRSLQEKVFEVLGFSKEEVQMDDLDDGRASPWGFLSAIFLGKNWCFSCQKERNNEWGFVNVSFKEENSWGWNVQKTYEDLIWSPPFNHLILEAFTPGCWRRSRRFDALRFVAQCCTLAQKVLFQTSEEKQTSEIEWKQLHSRIWVRRTAKG